MPSVVAGLKSLFKAVGLVDDVVDVSKAAKAATNAVTGGDTVVNLDKVRRISAAIIEIAGDFLVLDTAARAAFLSDTVALRRVTQEYYKRLDESGRDRYEKVFGGETWGAICDGLGMRKSQPEQTPNKNKQQQRKPAPASPPNVLRDIAEMELFLAIRISLGKAATAEDAATGNTDAGDKIITDGVERLRQATLGEKAEKAVKKGIGAFAETLKTINDELFGEEKKS